MSAASTPHRHGRGVAMAGIDTSRTTYERPMAALQYGGYYTPPQSAHESRRPSIACSAYSDAPYSATSTMTSFSLPPTPVHAEAMYHPGVESHGASLMPGLTAPSGSSHGQDNFKHLVLDISQAKLDYDMIWTGHAMPQQMAQDTTRSTAFDQTQNIWHGASVADTGFMVQPIASDGATWSASSNATGGAVSTLNAEPDWTIVDTSYSQADTVQYNAAAPSYYTLQDGSGLVNLAQVNAQDEHLAELYTPEGSPQQTSQDLSPGFVDGADSSFSSGYTEEYYHEGDDFVYVQGDSERSPTLDADMRALPSRKRSKANRRQRRMTHKQSVISRAGIEIVIQGENLAMDRHGDIRRFPKGSDKKYRCMELLPNGYPCGKGFARSEHLKRHSTSHLKKEKRKFKCPIETCKGKMISRSDNFCDHFRTHLKTPVRSQRNDFCHWDVLSALIERTMDDATAKKTLSNLRRWLLAPESDKEYPLMLSKHGLDANVFPLNR